MKYILVGSVSLQKWQNSAFYDRAFKLGGDGFWTNRNDLRYGAKKICNGPMKICLIFAIQGNFCFNNLMNTFKHLYRIFCFFKVKAKRLKQYATDQSKFALYLQP